MGIYSGNVIMTLFRFRLQTGFKVFKADERGSESHKPHTGKTEEQEDYKHSSPYSFNHIMAGKTETTQDNQMAGLLDIRLILLQGFGWSRR